LFLYIESNDITCTRISARTQQIPAFLISSIRFHLSLKLQLCDMDHDCEDLKVADVVL